jgi:hypothetical protein
MITRDMITKMDGEKRRVRKQVYTKIYEQFCRKIQSVVSVNHKHIILTVPPFMLGFPVYNVAQAATYLKRQLERSGFDVSTVSGVSLFVSWYPPVQKQTVEPPPRFIEPILEDDMTMLPTLVNLRKAANKYKPK